MIKSTNDVSSFSSVETTSSSHRKSVSKKNRNKKSRATATKKSLEIKCYKDLRTRKVVVDDPDRSMNAFITRTALKDCVFEDEERADSTYHPAFPRKSSEGRAISFELEKTYEKLSQIHQYMELVARMDASIVEENKGLIKEAIIELITIKQDIVTIWNKYNPSTPYKYGTKLENGRYILEDRILDFAQIQLYVCYSKINDDTNKLIIIDQLIEQKSGSCFGLLNSMFLKNITDDKKPDDLNFTDILTRYTEVAKFYKKENILLKNGCKNNQIAVIASIMKLYLDKSCIDYEKLITDTYLIDNFLDLVIKFSCFYQGNKNYTKKIRNLSLGIDLYYKNIDTPLFKGIHTAVLTDNGLVFASEFSNLIKKLLQATISYDKGTIKLANNKAKLDMHNQIYIQEINDIKQQIECLFIIYGIPTTDISSWYDTFLNDGFKEVFSNISVGCTVVLAKWVNVCINSGETSSKNIEIKDNIKKWLDILEKDYKYLANDTREWDNFPTIILNLFCNHLLGNSLRFTFSASGLFKNEDLAVLHAKMNQAFYPFLGTTLLAVAHKDSYDDLLSDIEMLEIFSQKADKTKYVNSSKYLIAQIITYLLDKNNQLTLDEKQFLFNKAEKLYLELADLGINRAYLLLAETTASLAKAKTHSKDFLSAIRLYDQASSYCNILSEVDGLESKLQDLAIININCFNAEADILRKFDEDQQSLLQDAITPTVKATAKNKKKSRKKIADSVKTNEQQESAKEVTTEEVINWHSAYKSVASKPINKKSTKVTIIEATSKLPTRSEIASMGDFWGLAKGLQMSATNLEQSYGFIEKLIQCDYFNMLVTQLKNGTAGKDSWVVLLLYQNMAYYHFLQQKYAQEIGNNMKLFNISESDIKGASKAEEANFVNISSEAEYLIRQVISLICPDIPGIKTKNIRELILSLSPDNYGASQYKRRLASMVSTYGHLISLDDATKGRRGKDRLAAAIYDKADEINPARVIKKLEKKAA
jgi:hypothetical protein